MTALSNHFETLARIGYGARGVVYQLLGGLALSSTILGTTTTDDTESALSTLLGAPLGRVALCLIALGLTGHFAWRLAQSILNADEQPKSIRGFAARGVHLASGILNGGLALIAARLAIEGRESGSGNQDWVEIVLNQPFGLWLAGIAGVCILVTGIAQMYSALMRNYARWMAIPPKQVALLDPICRFGIGARGALLVVVGGLVLFAALTVPPGEAGGTRAALSWLHEQPFGWLFYGFAALALFGFGAYMQIKAIHRRIDAPDGEDIKDAIPG